MVALIGMRHKIFAIPTQFENIFFVLLLGHGS